MSILPLYAGLIGLWLLLLSVRVIAFRRTARVNLGHGENIELERRIRAHANLMEYGPVALILLALLEWGSWSPVLLNLLGIMLIAGRFLHGWALSFTKSSSIMRVSGMVLTLTMIGISACLCLIEFVMAWNAGQS